MMNTLPAPWQTQGRPGSQPQPSLPPGNQLANRKGGEGEGLLTTGIDWEEVYEKDKNEHRETTPQPTFPK
jgi:hypothetical protein